MSVSLLSHPLPCELKMGRGAEGETQRVRAAVASLASVEPSSLTLGLLLTTALPPQVATDPRPVFKRATFDKYKQCLQAGGP